MVDCYGEKMLVGETFGLNTLCTKDDGEVIYLKSWTEVEPLGQKVIDN